MGNAFSQLMAALAKVFSIVERMANTTDNLVRVAEVKSEALVEEAEIVAKADAQALRKKYGISLDANEQQLIAAIVQAAPGPKASVARSRKAAVITDVAAK